MSSVSMERGRGRERMETVDVVPSSSFGSHVGKSVVDARLEETEKTFLTRQLGSLLGQSYSHCRATVLTQADAEEEDEKKVR